MIRASRLWLAATLLAAGCGETAPTRPSGAKPRDQRPATTAAAPAVTTVEPKAETKTPSNPNNPIVRIETSMGPIKVELFEDKAPLSVKNFLAYVEDRFYDGTIFHRVMPDFMIQGGGFEPGMKQKPTRPPIKNESDNGLSNLRGTVAMARTSAPDSATAQFYINVVDNPSLNRNLAEDGVGYCVFGQVLEGMAVVDKIRRVRTTRLGPHAAVPIEDVTIQSVRRVR